MCCFLVILTFWFKCTPDANLYTSRKNLKDYSHTHGYGNGYALISKGRTPGHLKNTLRDKLLLARTYLAIYNLTCFFFGLFFFQVPPKLNSDLKDESVSVYLYSLSRITCTESGDPEPNVTWTKNGTYFVNNNTLIINNVTLKDAGQYGCTAKNRAGKINATVWIEVLGKKRKA